MTEKQEAVLKALKAGDKVFIAHYYGGWSGPGYTPSTISKITPSGIIDVLIGFSKEPTRFSAEGRERGKFSRRQIDTEMTFAEREADLERNKRIEAANAALQSIAPEKLRRPERSDLVKEIERLRILLEKADKLIEAI